MSKKLQDWHSEASFTCGGKIFKGPDHEGSLPKEYNKMFFDILYFNSEIAWAFLSLPQSALDLA